MNAHSHRRTPVAPYFAEEVCRLSGVSYRQLDYWTRTHVVTASVAGATGPGSNRMFSDEDVARIKLIAALLKAGVSLQKIRRHGPRVALDRTIVSLQAVSDELERQMETVAS